MLSTSRGYLPPSCDEHSVRHQPKARASRRRPLHLVARRHVKRLKDAGVLDSEKHGLFVYYYVNTAALEELAGWLICGPDATG